MNAETLEGFLAKASIHVRFGESPNRSSTLPTPSYPFTTVHEHMTSSTALKNDGHLAKHQVLLPSKLTEPRLRLTLTYLLVLRKASPSIALLFRLPLLTL